MVRTILRSSYFGRLNNPAISDSKLIKHCERLEKEVREVDPNHILFLDSNIYSWNKFSKRESRFNNHLS